MALVIRPTIDQEYLVKVAKRAKLEQFICACGPNDGMGFRIYSHDEYMALQAKETALSGEVLDQMVERLEDALEESRNDEYTYSLCDWRFMDCERVLFAILYREYDSSDPEILSEEERMGYVAFGYAAIKSTALPRIVSACIEMISEGLA